MTTFQPGDRVRTTRDTISGGLAPVPAGTTGTVRYSARGITDVTLDGQSRTTTLSTEDLALEVNGL